MKKTITLLLTLCLLLGLLPTALCFRLLARKAEA